MDFEQFTRELDAWLEANRAELTPEHGVGGTLAEHMEHLSKVKQMTYDAGWGRYGWPEHVGGYGGTSLMRAQLGAALAARGMIEPGIYSMTETLVPTMIDYATAELAAVMVPRMLRGDETWCQGFSEPSTGSNLGSLTCRAKREDGGGWRVTGQKVWTSLAQFSQRCVLLTRTGSVESAHRGITALFVDMDSAGITVRPIETMHGAPEFCEVFLDEVYVPEDRMLGDEGQGWSVAMDLLPFERSTALWHRAAFLHQRLGRLLEIAEADDLHADQVGEVVQTLAAFQARSRKTQHRLASGDKLGSETSVDKILVATAEQAVFDLAAVALADRIVLGEDPEAGRWRADFLYSRAATIYGGSAEIQRNIIARRVLDLGNDR